GRSGSGCLRRGRRRGDRRRGRSGGGRRPGVRGGLARGRSRGLRRGGDRSRGGHRGGGHRCAGVGRERVHRGGRVARGCRGTVDRGRHAAVGDRRVVGHGRGRQGLRRGGDLGGLGLRRLLGDHEDRGLVDLLRIDLLALLGLAGQVLEPGGGVLDGGRALTVDVVVPVVEVVTVVVVVLTVVAEGLVVRVGEHHREGVLVAPDEPDDLLDDLLRQIREVRQTL